MSAIDIRSLSSVPAEPWRNGGGVTRTLAANKTEWRVSVAQVERDGPYSRFDGVTRVSFVLRGRGVTLRDGASVVRLLPFAAAQYDGGSQWNATLVDGPVSALNVMTAAGRYRTTVNTVVVATLVPPRCAAIVIALDSRCRYSETDTRNAGTIEAGQFLVLASVERPVRLEPVDDAGKPPIVVTITPATSGTTD